MPFTKTEVDIHTDYVVAPVDPEWLQQGVRPKHLMLDPTTASSAAPARTSARGTASS